MKASETPALFFYPKLKGEIKVKLKELKGILFSNRGNIQWAIVYDWTNNVDLTPECSVEYAISKFGDRTVHQIFADDYKLIISVI